MSRTREDRATDSLPGRGFEKPAYLVAGDNYLARSSSAETEQMMLDMGADLVRRSAVLLGNPDLFAHELRYLASRMNEALADVLRVAENRGGRLRTATASHGLGDGAADASPRAPSSAPSPSAGRGVGLHHI